MIVGVDPGKHGALAVIQKDMPLLTAPMPLFGDQYDAPTIVRFFEQAKESAPVRVFMERLRSMPKKNRQGQHLGGDKANFQRGYGLALFVGILAALRIPCELVPPHEWQKAMLSGVSSAGNSKEKALLVAKMLWPAHDWRESPSHSKLHDGFVDAALIAEYGSRLRWPRA